MRDLAKNQRAIYYSFLSSEGMDTDDYGYYTGEKSQQWTTPAKLRINVSTAKGEADRDAFGIFDDYDRTILTKNISCPIDIETRIWFEADPETEPYDYIVVRRADSKNVVRYALKKVRVS